MRKRIFSMTFIYCVVAPIAAFVLQNASSWIVDGLVTDVAAASPESAMDNRISSIFQYQIWAGALLAACSALVITRDGNSNVNRSAGLYIVVVCSVFSFAVGYVHFEVLHYFMESGTYLREFDSNLGYLHMIQSTLLVWAVMVFALMILRHAHD